MGELATLDELRYLWGCVQTLYACHAMKKPDEP
jgi:hypothetical protein